MGDNAKTEARRHEHLVSGGHVGEAEGEDLTEMPLYVCFQSY